MGKVVVRAGRRVSVVVLLVLVGSFVGASLTQAQKKPPPTCNLIPQLRDVTVNQGVGAYSPLVNGKETLVRFFLSMPTCAGSGASIQLTGGTLAVSGGGTVPAPTPVPSSTAYPVLASFTAAPMADSTGDPKFVVPASMVARTSAFTATFSTTLSYRSRPTTSSAYSAITTITFTNRPGTSTPISASFDRPSNAMGISSSPWATRRRRTRAVDRHRATGAPGWHDRGGVPGLPAPVGYRQPRRDRRTAVHGHAHAARSRSTRPHRRQQVLRHRRELRPDQGRTGAVPALAQRGQSDRPGQPGRGRRRSGHRARAALRVLRGHGRRQLAGGLGAGAARERPASCSASRSRTRSASPRPPARARSTAHTRRTSPPRIPR